MFSSNNFPVNFFHHTAINCKIKRGNKMSETGDYLRVILSGKNRFINFIVFCD
jgi:hypothetical protein